MSSSDDDDVSRINDCTMVGLAVVVCQVEGYKLAGKMLVVQ